MKDADKLKTDIIFLAMQADRSAEELESINQAAMIFQTGLQALIATAKNQEEKLRDKYPWLKLP